MLDIRVNASLRNWLHNPDPEVASWIYFTNVTTSLCPGLILTQTAIFLLTLPNTLISQLKIVWSCD